MKEKKNTNKELIITNICAVFVFGLFIAYVIAAMATLVTRLFL